MLFILASLVRTSCWVSLSFFFICAVEFSHFKTLTLLLIVLSCVIFIFCKSILFELIPLSAKKYQNAKQTTFPLLQVLARIKNGAFAVYCLLNFVLLVDFYSRDLFYVQNLFVKKYINKQAWNCPDSLILLYCLSFQHKPSKCLPVESQQLEQSWKYVRS